MLTLDVSFNSIKKTFDFDPPENLLYVNYSCNEIKTMENAGNNKYLQILKLDGNKIIEISGIEDLPNLQYLSLKHNRISFVSGLPLSIQQLHLDNNQISRLNVGFRGLMFLRVLDLSFNNIRSLKGLEDAENLMVLNLTGNKISKVCSLEPIEKLALLSDLNLNENPVQSKELYRLRVAYRLPQLRSLDEETLSPEDKIKAENLYGLDLEDRKAIFEEIFGEGFEDRRIWKSEMLEEESQSEEEQDLFRVNLKKTGSSLSLSRAASKDSLSSADINAYSKRYVGELIEKAEKNTGVAF